MQKNSGPKPGVECRKLAAHISELLDGEAPPILENWAFYHIQRCSYCQDQAAGMRDLIERCKGLRTGAPSKDCREKIVAQFRNMHKPPSKADSVGGPGRRTRGGD